MGAAVNGPGVLGPPAQASRRGAAVVSARTGAASGDGRPRAAVAVQRDRQPDPHGGRVHGGLPRTGGLWVYVQGPAQPGIFRIGMGLASGAAGARVATVYGKAGFVQPS